MKFIKAVAVALALAGALPATAAITNAPAQRTKQPVKVETFARGLVHPWGLAFLPDGQMLVTERPGRVRIVGKDGRLSDPVRGVPDVVASGQGGLLDIALDPNFAANRLVYLSFADPRGSGTNGTSVVRGKLVADGGSPRLDDAKVIFRQEPAATGGLHFGSRLAFARDGNLFVTTGDRYHSRHKAQDLATHYGKVIRIRPDGSVPPDNPFVNKSGARPETWSYGHRNPQSAAIHPTTGKLWTVEHAARGGDEINVPAAGKNYGWPTITYGIEYSGDQIGEGITAREGMEQPVYYWDPVIAPSGMAFYTGTRFPAWRGSLFVGGLESTHVARLTVDGDRIIGEERLLTDLQPERERIRDIRQGPDEALYILTDSANGRVLKLVPKGT